MDSLLDQESKNNLIKICKSMNIPYSNKNKKQLAKDIQEEKNNNNFEEIKKEKLIHIVEVY